MTQKSCLILALLILFPATSPAAQTAYPDKPMRVIVGFPPGVQPDIVTRLLSSKLSEGLGKPIVVENRPGSGGVIAAERLAKTSADGYTIGVLNQGQLVINPALRKVPYDPVKDFSPVSQIAGAPNILVVHNSVPAKNLGELIQLAKSRAGELTFASNGSGTAPHMSAELLKFAAKLDIRHVPYGVGGAAIPDLLSGRVNMMFGTIAALMPMVREGKVRALAATIKSEIPKWARVVKEAGIKLE